MNIVRVYAPDPERQRAALALLLRAAPHDGVGSPCGEAVVSDPETAYLCHRGDGDLGIVWSTTGPPTGDGLEPFEYVEPIDFYNHPVDEQAEERLAYLWSLGVECKECGRPLLFEGVTCLCEDVDNAA